MKTLADMTEEERAECVGMWCGYNRHLKGGKPQDFVIMIEDINEAGRISCINPGAPEPKAWAPDPWMLTPRFDLPRAWHPDGQPPQGEWEYAEYLGDHGGMTDVFYFDGDPTHRQWKSEWEEL